MKSYLFALFLLFGSSFCRAQKPEKTQYKRISLDLYGGTPIFLGDVKNEFKNYQISSRLNFGLTSALSLGAAFSYGKVNGLDKNTASQYFSNHYVKVLVGGEAYLFNALKFYELGNKFQLYAGFNLGAVKAKLSRAGANGIADVTLQKAWSFAHQWHLGAKYKLSKTLELNVRGTFLAMNSDMFDNQDNGGSFSSGNDALVNAELGLTVHFGKKEKEPLSWHNPRTIENNSFASDSMQTEQSIPIESINNEAKNAVKLATLNMEKNDLISQVKALELKLDELLKAQASSTSVNSDNELFPLEESLYEALLVGPIDANFFIISGSFSVLTNANQQVKALEKLGYSPVIMREPFSNNLHRVVVDSSNSYQNALQLLDYYKKELDSKAWILKQRR